MWEGVAYMKQWRKEQLDSACPEEWKNLSWQAKPHVWPRSSPASSVKLSFLDSEDRLTCLPSKPQSWWMKVPKLLREHSLTGRGKKEKRKSSVRFSKRTQRKEFDFHIPVTAGHMESGRLPREHLQQLTKLLGRQKRRRRTWCKFQGLSSLRWWGTH